MIIPTHDDNPCAIQPWLTGLIGIGTLCMLLFSLHHGATGGSPGFGWDVDGNVLEESEVLGWILLAIYGFVTIGLVWIFGDNVEESLGRRGMLGIWAAGGAFSVTIELATTGSFSSAWPVGSTAAIFGAYQRFFHDRDVHFIIFLPPRLGHGRAWMEDRLENSPDGSLFPSFMIPAFAVAAGWFVVHLIVAAVSPTLDLSMVAPVAGGVVGFGLACLRPVPLSTPVRSSFDVSSDPVNDDDLDVSDLDQVPLPVVETGRWGVIHLHRELQGAASLARDVAAATGETAVDVARRISTSRGLLARGLAEESARELSDFLNAAGGNTAAVDMPYALPPASIPAAVAWSEQSVALQPEEGAEPIDIPWYRVRLVLAARIRDSENSLTRGRPTPVVELVVRGARGRPPTRWRLLRPYTRFLGGDETARHPRDFARAVLAAGGVAANEGVRVLAQGGRWGYLNFHRPDALDLHATWLWWVVEHHASAADRSRR